MDGENLSSIHYQFFISDHLGNTRSIVERIDESTALVQEIHYYPYGAVMEGVGLAGDWDFLYQGKEFLDFNGGNLYDFNARSYDAYIGRFWQLDGANQFASGYIGMGNMPSVGVDPDGQFAWFIWAGAAVISGTNNLISNWSKVKDLKSGLAYFGSGAIGGVVSLTPAGFWGGAATTAGLNVGVDIWTGNIPKLDNFGDYAKYGLKLGLDGLGAGSGGGISKWAFNGGLKNLFGWIQSPYLVKNPGTELVGGELVSWTYDVGVASSKAPLGGLAANAAKRGLNLADDVGRGFSSMSKFKSVYGKAGQGQAWHHIVEQHADNIGKFGAESIHNTNNLIKLPHGVGSIHNKISGYYSSKDIFTNGQTVRQWLKGQSYDKQYEFGMNTLKRFGWLPR